MKYGLSLFLPFLFLVAGALPAHAETISLGCDYVAFMTGPGYLSITESPSAVSAGQPVTLSLALAGYIFCGPGYSSETNPTPYHLYYGGPYVAPPDGMGEVPSIPSSSTLYVTIGGNPCCSGPQIAYSGTETVYPTQSGYWTVSYPTSVAAPFTCSVCDAYTEYNLVSTYVTVLYPDLTAGSVTPTSASASTPVTLSSTISNTGTGSTISSFTTLFQKANDAQGNGATDIGTATVGTLASNTSGTATLSYTFPSQGTSYVRACADKASANGTGTITESNENNNCGAWTAVTVASAYQCADGIDNDGDGKIDYPADPGCTSPTDTDERDSASCSGFSANPTSILSGQSSTLSWSCQNATSCTGTNFSTGGATSGTQSVAPSSSTTYSLSCNGAGGNASVNVNVTVNPPASLHLSAQSPVKLSTTSTLTWSAINIQSGSCRISGTNGDTFSLSGTSGTKTSSALTTETVYTLTCTDLNSIATSSAPVTVKLVPKFQEI